MFGEAWHSFLVKSSATIFLELNFFKENPPASMHHLYKSAV